MADGRMNWGRNRCEVQGRPTVLWTVGDVLDGHKPKLICDAQSAITGSLDYLVTCRDVDQVLTIYTVSSLSREACVAFHKASYLVLIPVLECGDSRPFG